MTKYGIIFYKNTDNFGDDIQTFAAKRFLPRIDYIIERENLRGFIPNKRESVKVIMNGWFAHNKLTFPPSPYINPLLTSMHFTSNEYDVGDSYIELLLKDYLKSKEVGCRDIETENKLQKYGIKTYFSGCLTLTLENHYTKVNPDSIICVDISDKIKSFLDMNNVKYKMYFNSIDSKQYSKKSFEERMKLVEKRLKVYASAKIVFTSRLHTLLPCLALGIRVILILPRNYEKDRFDSYLKFVEYYFEDDFLNTDFNEILNNFQKKDSINSIKEKLESECKEFIDKKNCFLKTPSINNYKKQLILLEKDHNLYQLLQDKEKNQIQKLNNTLIINNKKANEVWIEKNRILSEYNLLKNNKN